MTRPKRTLVMGVGNTLMQDDGAGIHVTELLRQSAAAGSMEIVDGGTIGLSLLPLLEDADNVIVVDASEIGKPPGSVAVFRNAEIDQLLSARRRTVHEVALMDLFAAAAIRGRSPTERALVAIQPACTEPGLDPTPAVRAATLSACEAVLSLARQWRTQEAAA
ncbi:MAG: HyaD/HybD family hydrogenase maturation endopeptidase [Lysobacterales bacterium]|jgi:hydrogenase maturation protease